MRGCLGLLLSVSPLALRLLVVEEFLQKGVDLDVLLDRLSVFAVHLYRPACPGLSAAVDFVLTGHYEHVVHRERETLIDVGFRFIARTR